MIMPSGLRKAVLTAHVTSSVGWLGAVVAFLVLAIIGLVTNELQTGRSAYLVMEIVAWFAIVPFNAASLATGIIQSLGTNWGLFRHYWVLIKLVITILATAALVVHMQPISIAAVAAADAKWSLESFYNLRIQLVVDAGAALLVLLIATTLSVFKPRGLTRYGWQKQREQVALSRI